MIYKAIQHDGFPHVRIGGIGLFERHTINVDEQTSRDWLDERPQHAIARRVKRGHYSRTELSAAIGVHTDTLRRWRLQGMPTCWHRFKYRVDRHELIDWARKYPHVWEHVRKLQ